MSDSGSQLELLPEKKQPTEPTKNDKSQPGGLSPMLRHYLQLKKETPEHIFFYQVGDFYEIFFDDAEIVSSVLGIRLTARHKDSPSPVPMCGVPIHAIDNYLPKLVSAGYSTVLVSQVGETGGSKKIVKREINRVLTPGVRYQGDGIEENKYNFLAAVCIGPNQNGAIAFTDVSTGILRVQAVDSIQSLIDAICRIQAAEIIIPSTLYSLQLDSSNKWLKQVKQTGKELASHIVQRPFQKVSAKVLSDRISKLLLEARSLEGSSLDKLDAECFSALAAVLDYVEELSFGKVPKISQFEIEEQKNVVFIDYATRRNLELTEARIDGDTRNSLLANVDFTKTPMGVRLFRERILSPCTKLEEIEKRLSVLSEFLDNRETLDRIRELFSGVRDIDRLISRIITTRATPKDLGVLKESIQNISAIKQSLSAAKSEKLGGIFREIDPLADVYQQLDNALADELPIKINEAGIFRDGYLEQIDELRIIRKDGRKYIAGLEAKEKQKLGINAGLKIKFNNVFGYFIEVTKTHIAKVPEHYERKQTLVNAERFVTKELKEFEVKILSAKERLIDLERKKFIELRNWLSEQAGRLQATSILLAELDVFASLAYLAREYNYSRPEFAIDGELEIVSGRHPVVERVIGQHNFVPNNTFFNQSSRHFAVLSGPNMGGKSTYLRQVGLIQLLAQVGSFVPAERAKLPLVDRIFTRIGAADDLSRGDSTFMVEMRETAIIVKKATKDSLVLIDEIGRGTATTDGLAIATAVAEWLHDKVACKTIFATHFHELTDLSNLKEGVFCLAVGVHEEAEEIVFTHLIEEKAVDKSYGVEVAKLAGLPAELVERAKQLLSSFDKDTNKPKLAQSVVAEKVYVHEPSADYNRIKARLEPLKPNNMTPIEALGEIVELKKLLEK